MCACVWMRVDVCFRLCMCVRLFACAHACICICIVRVCTCACVRDSITNRFVCFLMFSLSLILDCYSCGTLFLCDCVRACSCKCVRACMRTFVSLR